MKAEDFKWEDFPPRLSPSRDRLGRHNHDPKRFMHGIQGVLWLAEHVPMAEVPGEYWSEDVRGEGRVAVVACPCGEAPLVPLLEAPVACDCERVFAFTGKDVLAFNSPA